MKKLFLLFAFIAFGHLVYSQQGKKVIDYQYFRDEKNYYAFELFQNDADEIDDQLMLNFSSNAQYNKIEKIYLKAGAEEFKLKFRLRGDLVKSDNPEQKFYPISLDGKDLKDKKLPCDAQIVFKLDNGNIYLLPFKTCTVSNLISKN